MSFYSIWALLLAALLSVFFRSKFTEKIKAFHLFVLIVISALSQFVDRVDALKDVVLIICTFTLLTILLLLSKVTRKGDEDESK